MKQDVFPTPEKAAIGQVLRCKILYKERWLVRSRSFLNLGDNAADGIRLEYTCDSTLLPRADRPSSSGLSVTHDAGGRCPQLCFWHVVIVVLVFPFVGRR